MTVTTIQTYNKAKIDELIASVSGYEEYNNLDWTGLYDSSTFKILKDLKMVFVEGDYVYVVEIPKDVTTNYKLSFNRNPTITMSGSDMIITKGFCYAPINLTTAAVTTFTVYDTQVNVDYSGTTPTIPSSVAINVNFTKALTINDAMGHPSNNYVVMLYKP